MKCHNCSWGWEIDKDDTHPFLCHKCGYDSQIGDFDMVSLQKWKEENNYPFDEYIDEGYHIRTFYEDTDDNEFVWHKDREDRIVESIGDTDWMVQIDNELPKSLNESVFIPKGKYHRVIKGSGNLKIKVKKFINEGVSIEKKLQVALDYAFDYLRNICTDDEEYFLNDFCNEFDTIEELKINRVEKSEYKDYFDVYVDIKLNCISYYDYEYDFFNEIKKIFPVDGFFLILNDIIRPKLDW